MIKLNACGKLTKVVFILLNILYLLIGLALIGVGSYLIHTGESLSFFTGNEFFSGAALLIICGIVVFIITALGIVGGLFQHRFLLYIYLIAVVIIIILEIVAGILGFVYRDTITETAGNRAVDAINDYRPKNNSDFNAGVNDAIDFIQERFKCCGWNNASVWETTVYFELTMSYPASCECVDKSRKCENVTSGQEIYTQACDLTVSDFLERNVIAAGIAGIVFAIAQLIPVLLVLGLLYAIHKANTAYVTV